MVILVLKLFSWCTSSTQCYLTFVSAFHSYKSLQKFVCDEHRTQWSFPEMFHSFGKLIQNFEGKNNIARESKLYLGRENNEEKLTGPEVTDFILYNWKFRHKNLKIHWKSQWHQAGYVTMLWEQLLSVKIHRRPLMLTVREKYVHRYTQDILMNGVQEKGGMCEINSPGDRSLFFMELEVHGH